jgi:MFS transporter, BCD family, chlorophyll transporter
MTTESFPTTATELPNLKLITMFRLGLFQAGLGIMSLLTLGVLNRVMIKELAIPATIVAGAIAMNQFVAPVRVWFGQMSDSKPIGGYHRTGYVWIGSAIFTIASFLAVQVVWQLGNSVQTYGLYSTPTYGWIGFLAFVFAIYGVALSSSSTPFAALLVDISEEDNRPKLVGIVWSMLMVGIIVGAIITGGLLRTIDLDTPLPVVQSSINRIFTVIPAIVFGLTLIATYGIEKKYSRYTTRSMVVDREDQITLGRALKVLTASRQTGLFFVFLLTMTICLFFQEPILEPYGGEIFGMTIGDTTRLNAFWGTGTLVGLSLTGFLIVPRLGKKNTTKLGCIFVAAAFILIILAGLSTQPKALQLAVLVLGFASGITTTGALSLMLDLTAAETAGTFIGAWGLSQAMARAIATVAGGALLDLGRQVLKTPMWAYGAVFVLPIFGMMLAIKLLSRVNVKEFQTEAKAAIAQVLEQDL